MDIEIKDAELVEFEMLGRVLSRALQFERAFHCTVWPKERVPLDAPEYKHPGWLEYGLQVFFEDNSEMWIGCIQRRPGEPVEFHS